MGCPFGRKWPLYTCLFTNIFGGTWDEEKEKYTGALKHKKVDGEGKKLLELLEEEIFEI